MAPEKATSWHHEKVKSHLSRLLASEGNLLITGSLFHDGYPSFTNKMPKFKPQREPGIYVFYSGQNVLYVGEALSLFNRVNMAHNKIHELFPFGAISVSVFSINCLAFQLKKTRVNIERKLIELYGNPILNNETNIALKLWGKSTLKILIEFYFSELTFKPITYSRGMGGRTAIDWVYMNGESIDLIAFDLRNASKPQAEIEAAIKLYKSKYMFPKAMIYRINEYRYAFYKMLVKRINPALLTQVNSSQIHGCYVDNKQANRLKFYK